MPEEPIATLIKSNDPEGRDVTWKEVGQTPTQFLLWLMKRIAVDFSKVRTIIPVFIGKQKPDGSNNGKLHIQDSNPPRIGVPTQTGYQYLDLYPRNVIMGWRGSRPIPPFLTALADSEVTQLGLPKNVPNSLVWVVYPE